MVDACVHTDAYKRTEKDFDYKLYIMELAMEWVEEKCQIELSRSMFLLFFCPLVKNGSTYVWVTLTNLTTSFCDGELDFQLPNIKSKDELKKRSVILPKPPAIQEMEDSTPSKKEASKKAIITPVSSKPATPSSSKLALQVHDKDTGIVVPTAGKDDIALQSRLLPCPKGTLGIIVEVDLPNHVRSNKCLFFFCGSNYHDA